MNCARLSLNYIWSPLKVWCRHRTGKVHISRPQAPHWDKQVMLAVVRPDYQKEKFHQPKEIPVKSPPAVVEENPYERLLSKELAKKFQESQMIAIFHRNSWTAQERNKIRILCIQNEMHLANTNKTIVKMAVEGTQHESILCLFQSQTQLVFSNEVNVAKLIKMTKKMPQLVLLAAVVRDRFLSCSQLDWYANLPDLDGMRQQLCATLASSSTRTYQHLSHHQTMLTHNLAQFVKQKSDTPESTSSDTPESATSPKSEETTTDITDKDTDRGIVPNSENNGDNV